MKVRRIIKISGVMASVSLLCWVGSHPSRAQIALRHILPTLQDVQIGGDTMVEGEITYDLVRAKVLARVNGQLLQFPPTRVGNPSFAYSQVSINPAQATDPTAETVTLLAGSVFRMSDHSLLQLSADQSFTVASIQSATPLAAGWNFLYLQSQGGTLAVLATSTYGATTTFGGALAYIGSTYVTLSSSVPALSSSRRVGTRYFYHGAPPSIPAAGTTRTVSLNLPSTAERGWVFAKRTDPDPSNASANCFSYSINSADFSGPCSSEALPVPRASDGSFTLVLPTSGTLVVDITGYEEGLNTLR